MATASAKRTVKKVKEVANDFNLQNSLEKGFDSVRKIAGEVNTVALNSSEVALEAAVKTGVEWQNVAAKAIEGGLSLSSKQQEIVFDALTGVKEQLMEGRANLRKLFASN